MSEDVKMVLDETKSTMQTAIGHLDTELSKVRAGKANPSMLESIMVDYYGSMMPIGQVSNITTTDARTLKIQPWEKAMVQPIADSIMNSNLSLNPQNLGDLLIITLPPLTEERRKDLVKRAKSEGEHAKVSIRNHRKEANDMIKSLVKDGLPEDEGKDAEAKIQELTNQFIAKVEAIVDAKEKDIMTV
ncbi:MAG: ribosome recycling factor [Bacteroidota bacterium]